jgi:hypothetical protein
MDVFGKIFRSALADVAREAGRAAGEMREIVRETAGDLVREAGQVGAELAGETAAWMKGRPAPPAKVDLTEEAPPVDSAKEICGECGFVIGPDLPKKAMLHNFSCSRYRVTAP